VGDAEAVILVDIDAPLLRAAPSNCQTTNVVTALSRLLPTNVSISCA
jgi:hypothetical protein